MPAPDIDLANQALRLLGEFAITAFDDGTALADTAGLLQLATVRQMLTAHPWRFTMAKAPLARLTDAPTTEWRYQHALPPDMLVLRALRDTAAVGANPLLQYELFDGRAYSDSLELWADYQRWVDPGYWPPTFYAAARYALAADYAVAVGASASVADLFHRRAYGTPQENGRGGLFGIAARADSQQQPPQAMHDFPLITARQGGRWRA